MGKHRAVVQPRWRQAWDWLTEREYQPELFVPKDVYLQSRGYVLKEVIPDSDFYDFPEEWMEDWYHEGGLIGG